MASKKIYFWLAFTITGLIFSQIKFTQLAGANISFTLFDFFAPVAGVFLGGLFGIVSVLAVSLFNFVTNGSFAIPSLIRLYPTLFAVWYFSLSPKQKPNKWVLLFPLLSIVSFWLHPVGREAWYYPLMWLIPLAAYFKRDWLYLRALGATFTAHAVGGLAWIWAFNLPASVWQGLIPVVLAERLLFAGGISLAYMVFARVLKLLTAKRLIPSNVLVS